MNFPISATSGKMGRPPLHLKPRLIRLSERAIDEIEALVGKNRLSQFVREAIDREIERRKNLKNSSENND